MDLFLFIYNILLIILFTCVALYSFNAYSYKKNPLHLLISLLFGLFIFDNTIIYMTEFMDNFSHIYALQFMTIPYLKTLTIILITICYFLIQKYALNKNLIFLDYFVLILFSIYLLFIPMALDGASMVWCYYLGCQLITIYLSSVGLLYLKQNPKLIKDSHFLNIYKKILTLTLIFSFLIILEDTIVIFSFDVYSDILVKINNRNLCEDIVSIIYSIFAIKYFSQVLKSTIIEETNKNEVSSINEFDFSSYAFSEFSKFYNLTKREQDVLKVLLTNKNNQEISDELFISIGTVKTHIHNIFQKVDVNKRSMLLDIYNEFNSKILDTLPEM